MNDLIFISLEPWDDIWRRNQFLCAELARRHPRMKLLFVEPAQDLSHAVRRGRWQDLRTPAPWRVPGMENITVTRPAKLLPNSLAAGRVVNQAVARRHVRRMARSLGMQRPLLWLNPHDAVHMVGRMGEAAAVYDITDDWTRFTQRESLRQRIVAEDAELCRRADAVIVCSEDLHHSKQGMARNLHLIPNGVDAEHYRDVLDATGPLPEAAQGWASPVLGYTGTIHTDRVDVDLLEAVAHGMSRGTVVLIGPNHLSESARRRLAATGRVVMPGPMPYERLPQHMRAFDVCIVPHRVTPFTESLNPIKLWEYLAAGKPIVSTPVAGFRSYPRHVYLAEGAEAFLAGVEAALAEDPSRREARRAEAQHHAWSARVDEVERVLAGILTEPSPRGEEPAVA